jgi:hypothetical protein
MYKCLYCEKKFARASTLKRHLTDYCNVIKENKKINNDSQKIISLEKQIEDMKKLIIEMNNKNSTNLTETNVDNSNNINKQINNQVNGNIVTNNNIKIEFGKEDLSKISNDFFIKTLLNFSGSIIPSKIIEGIHFNPELKENMSVYIADVSRNRAMIHDGNKWNLANAEETVNILFDKAVFFCEDKNEELYDKIQKNEKIKKKINKEMYIMNIMNNNQPYAYNQNNEPIDIYGSVLGSTELKRGEKLCLRAKEQIQSLLYNKKEIIKKNDKK